MTFRVALDMYRGPLDLLLYLVRKHEVDITDIPIAQVADQYLAYVALLEKIDVNAVGDFLDLASTLIEIKSRMLLPRADEVDDPLEDPRQELVERLLEYKRFKDAASILEEQSRSWQQRSGRRANDLPARRMELADQPIQEVELWDLVSALGRMMRENQAARPASIVYDETPIQTYMRQIHSRLVSDRRLAYSEMFRDGMHKSAMIGIFLAVLELARHHNVRAEQNELHGEIWILPSEGFSDQLHLESADGYEHERRKQRRCRPNEAGPMIENLPVKSLTHNGLTIEGYSRAAVQTYWRIPELKIGLDLGAQPWDFMGTPTWLVSHMHLDHMAALPVYVARRRMMKMEPPVIYLPEHAIDLVDKLLKVVSRLDRGRLPCQLLPARPGEEIELSRELVITPVPTRHTVPSLGYVIWERRRKLRPEYRELSGDQIRDLRLAGTDVTQEIRIAKLAYLGDSAPEGLDDNPAMFEAEILIFEMTFVAPRHRKEKIHKMGHIHLDDVLARRDRFQNGLMIASHFSTRYHERQVRHYVQKALPDMMGGRLHLWL